MFQCFLAREAKNFEVEQFRRELIIIAQAFCITNDHVLTGLCVKPPVLLYKKLTFMLADVAVIC